MGTRSAIGILEGDTCKAVYCHWDGYLAHNGKILYHHYKDPEKVARLINYGFISSLGPEIGEKHDFNTRVEGVCTFYGRDRGETGVDPVTVDSAEQLFKEFDWCEYFYVMKDGVWYVSDTFGSPWQRLDTALIMDKLEE